MSHFAFLQSEWPELFEAAAKAESLANADARTSCFYARRGLEQAMHWLFKHDPALRLPAYEDNLSALIHEPTFRKAAGDAVFNKARAITKLGNGAVHGRGPVRQYDAHTAVRELFHVAYWLARTYARGTPPAPGLEFKPDTLPKTAPVPPQTQAQLQQLEAQLRQAQAHEIGGRHDQEHADHDGGERHHGRIAERGLEVRIAQHVAVGVEAILATAHAQRELEGRDERDEEVDGAENDGEPGTDAALFHRSHRSLRERSTI